ncbi:MAG: DNA methyltransferase [Hymenobacter sp.]
MILPKNQVFQQDVLEFLRNLPDNSLDMVYGDPDYNVGINYAGRNYTTKWEEYIDWYGELARESVRVLKEDGNLSLSITPSKTPTCG